MDVLLAELFREPMDPPVRPEGPTARILRDLWLGGMPLPRAAAAAGLTTKDAEQTLRSLGLLPLESGRRPVRNDRDQSRPAQNGPKRRRRNWSALRDDVVRLYGDGRTIRAIAIELGMPTGKYGASSTPPASPAGPAAPPGSYCPARRWSVSTSTSSCRSPRWPAGSSSTQAVARNLRSYGLPRCDRHAPLDRDTLRRLYVDERLGVRAAAARLGVSPDKVRAELGRYGIQVRRPGGPSRRAG